MKRFILVLLSVLLCLSLFSCEGDVVISSSSEVNLYENEVIITADDIRSLHMIINDTWENGEDISVQHYYAYFLDNYGFHLTEQANAEKYPDGFPAEEFESFIRLHFDVSVEHLRSDKSIYREETNTYKKQLMVPHIVSQVKFDENNVIKDNDVFVVTAKVSAYPNISPYETREYRLKRVGDKFKYISCKLIKEESNSEALYLFRGTISMLNLLYSESPYDTVYKIFGGDIEIDETKSINVGEVIYCETTGDYQILEEYCGRIFTDEALEWFMSLNFKNVNGKVYCSPYGGKTGHGISDVKVEKTDSNTYKAQFCIKDHEKTYHSTFKIKETPDGYKISAIEFL